MVSSGTRRIAALWFPRLSTDRLQRRWKARTASGASPEPQSEAPPLVVVARAGNALKLFALDRKATALGLSVGMPLADARAMLPALKVVTSNAPADAKLLERIADWCDRFTPFVALDGPRGLLLDVTGAAHLHGGEKALLERIRAGLRDQGFAVRGALAASAPAARALARFRDEFVVPPGEDAQCVAPLPIEALGLDAVTTHAFRRAGLKTVGMAMGRTRRELTARFGAAMVQRFDAALGSAQTPISPRIRLADYSAEHRFAEPIVTDTAILRTLHALSEILAAMLAERGEGARRLDGAFFRADGAVRRIFVETGQPTREPAMIERLFREKIDALADPLDPGFGFDLIRLGASRTERDTAQAPGFGSGESEAREIGFLIDRLAARFGSHRVLVFRPNDTHIPEAAWTAVPALYTRAPERGWGKSRRPDEAPRRPLRMLTRPESVEVEEGDTPRRFRWRRASHGIAHAEGPERIAMEWWRHQSPQPARDYFRVEDEDGRRFWLYREENPAPRWFLQGGFA